MFGRAITLFKVFGFAVRIDLSWLFILLLVTWSLSKVVFPSEVSGLPEAAYWAMGFVTALVMFACVVVHELCHSLVARVFGLPIRGITLFLLGGVAEMSEEPPSAKAEFFIAAAGPREDCTAPKSRVLPLPVSLAACLHELTRSLLQSDRDAVFLPLAPVWAEQAKEKAPTWRPAVLVKHLVAILGEQLKKPSPPRT